MLMDINIETRSQSGIAIRMQIERRVHRANGTKVHPGFLVNSNERLLWAKWVVTPVHTRDNTDSRYLITGSSTKGLSNERTGNPNERTTTCRKSFPMTFSIFNGTFVWTLHSSHKFSICAYGDSQIVEISNVKHVRARLTLGWVTVRNSHLGAVCKVRYQFDGIR